MKKRFIILLIFAIELFAGEKWTLERAALTALEKNVSILQAKNNSQIYENSTKHGNAGLLPTVAATANGAYNYSNASNIPGQTDTRQTSTQYGLSVSQTVFSGFAAWYQYRLLQSQSESARWQERQTIENILLQSSSAWYALLAAQENLAITREALTISQERFQRTQASHQLGASGKLDFLNAQVDLAADSVSYLAADADFQEKRRMFERLIGEKIDEDAEFIPAPDVFTDYTLSELEEKLLENNSGLKIAELTEKQAQLQVSSSQASIHPTVTASANLGLGAVNPQGEFQFDDYTQSNSVALSLSLPLFTGGKRKIQIENARIRLNNQKLLQKDIQWQSRQSLETAYNHYRNQLRQLATQEAALEAAELNFKQAEEMYKLGQITATRFREAQLNLLNSHSRRNQAKYSALIYESQLLQLSGQIVEKFAQFEQP
jgi:outer membrane protein